MVSISQDTLNAPVITPAKLGCGYEKGWHNGRRNARTNKRLTIFAGFLPFFMPFFTIFATRNSKRISSADGCHRFPHLKAEDKKWNRKFKITGCNIDT